MFNKLKQKLLLIAIICFIIAGNTACSDDVEKPIDYSSIETLYEKPLEVIQKCVEGKWKLLNCVQDGWETKFSNTFINIMKDEYANGLIVEKIVITAPVDETIFLLGGASFSWKKIKHHSINDYIWAISPVTSQPPNDGCFDLFPISIKNDTLHLLGTGIGVSYKLLKIKEDE